MAFIRKVTRVSNPKRRHTRAKGVRKGVRNAKGRFVKAKNRRHTRKRANRGKTKTKNPVIRRYTVKSLKKELKRRGVKLNAGSSSRKSGKRHRRHTRRKQNPVLIELGALNPKRRKNVAKTRKRKARKSRNPRRHAAKATVTRRRRRRYTRRRRSNPVVRHHRRRRVHHRRRRVHNRRHRRNPALFGRSGGKDLLMMVGGGLVGVAATKYLPTLLPSSITAGLGGGPIMSLLITGAGAFAAGWLARRFVGGAFGDAVLFGGLMQTGSMALTAFAPPALSSRLALSGLGEIVPGMFVVPQNPIKDYRPPAPPANSGMGNLRRFGTFR